MTASLTIIDVLENALGDLTVRRVEQLTEAELETLAETVNQFYAGWTAPEVADDDLRIYSGGWIAGNLEGYEPRQYLYTSLIYAPSVVMHDHIAEWFYPDRTMLKSPPSLPAKRRTMYILSAEPQLLLGNGYYVFRHEPHRSREYLARVVPTMAALAPLIRANAVVPVPHLKVMRSHQDAILAAVRHDVQNDEFIKIVSNPIDEQPPRADQIRGMDTTPSDGVLPGYEKRAAGQNPSYFLNKTLAIAEVTNSLYVPPAATDAALLKYRINLLERDLARKDIDLTVTSALTTASLPFLGSLDIETLLSIRQDEIAFADWRRELRMIAHTIDRTPEEGALFAKDAREILSDALLPRVHEIEKAISRSVVMKSAATSGVVDLGVGITSTAGATALMGTSVGASTLVGLGLAAVNRWVFRSAFRPTPSGTAGILATLIKRR